MLALGIFGSCSRFLTALTGDKQDGRIFQSRIVIDCAIGRINLQRRGTPPGLQIGRLRREVSGLQNSDRVLEKAARNELGMAHPDDLIFIFDRSTAEADQ